MIELRCSECGYGICTTERPPACPMCQSATWVQVPPRRLHAVPELGRAARP